MGKTAGRIAALLLFLAVGLQPVGRAGDDIQAVTGLWNSFVQSLARGEYRQAHSLFSAESRAALPFTDFLLEYSPVSIAREMVLVHPENVATTLDGDWAELTYGGFRPGTGRPFTVAVNMVRNGREWGLVAARNERQERLEASARSLLRMAASVRGLPNAAQLMQDIIAREHANPALAHYRFDTNGAILKAIPGSPGLRAFHVDASGTVWPGLEPRPAPQAPPPIPEPPQPEPPAAPVLVDGLPELGEPPPPPPGMGLGDMPDLSPPPPMIPGVGAMERLPEPEVFALPDVVQ